MPSTMPILRLLLLAVFLMSVVAMAVEGCLLIPLSTATAASGPGPLAHPLRLVLLLAIVITMAS